MLHSRHLHLLTKSVFHPPKLQRASQQPDLFSKFCYRSPDPGPLPIVGLSFSPYGDKIYHSAAPLCRYAQVALRRLAVYKLQDERSSVWFRRRSLATRCGRELQRALYPPSTCRENLVHRRPARSSSLRPRTITTARLLPTEHNYECTIEQIRNRREMLPWSAILQLHIIRSSLPSQLQSITAL